MCCSGINSRPRGAALIIAMLVMAVLLMAGTAFLTISSTESQIALNERANAQALLLAEAGIHQAMARLNGDSSITSIPSTPLGGGTYSVAIVTVAGCSATSARDLTSTGSVSVQGGQAQVVLRARVDQVAYPYKWALFAAVPNLVVTGGRREKELWLDKGGQVDSFDSTFATYEDTSDSVRHRGGSIGANGDVTVKIGGVIWGNVSAGDAVHADWATVHGTTTQRASSQSFPSVSPSMSATGSLRVDDNRTRTLSEGTYAYTSIDVGNNGTLATRGAVTIYVTGNVEFGNNSALTVSGGPVTIYVNGDVSLGNSVTWGSDPGTQLQIITRSNLPDSQTDDIPEFEAGNDWTFYGRLYGKSTDIKLGNDARIYGSIIGRTVKLGNNGRVHYNQALSNKVLCTFGTYNLLRRSWREVYPTS